MLSVFLQHTWLFSFLFWPTEVSPILHMCHMMGTEMIHFIHQMQYYITFEVRTAIPLPLSSSNCFSPSPNRLASYVKSELQLGVRVAQVMRRPGEFLPFPSLDGKPVLLRVTLTLRIFFGFVDGSPVTWDARGQWEITVSRPRTQHNDPARCSTGIQRASDVFPSTVGLTFHVLYIQE